MTRPASRATPAAAGGSSPAPAAATVRGVDRIWMSTRIRAPPSSGGRRASARRLSPSLWPPAGGVHPRASRSAGRPGADRDGVVEDVAIVTTDCTIAPAGPRTALGAPPTDRETRMPLEYHCAQCNETFREDTVEGVLKRAAAHNHAHHGGPE